MTAVFRGVSLLGSFVDMKRDCVGGGRPGQVQLSNTCASLHMSAVSHCISRKGVLLLLSSGFVRPPTNTSL